LNDLAAEPLWPALPVSPRSDHSAAHVTGWYDPDSSAFNADPDLSPADSGRQPDDLVETAAGFIDWT
jgi:hypothetical protein